MAGSMSERSLGRRYRREIVLRMAAYRACHEGRLPPVNSDLWREFSRLATEGEPGLLSGLFGARRRWPWSRRRPERERGRPRPLFRFRLEMPFLTDDFSPEAVEARLGSWPMVLAFGPLDRHPMGEWFVYVVEVLAEDALQARKILDCIFAVPAPE